MLMDCAACQTVYDELTDSKCPDCGRTPSQQVAFMQMKMLIRLAYVTGYRDGVTDTDNKWHDSLDRHYGYPDE